MTDAKRQQPPVPKLRISTTPLGTKRQVDDPGHLSHAKKWAPVLQFSRHCVTRQIIQAHTQWLWPLLSIDTNKGVWPSLTCGPDNGSDLVRSPTFSHLRSYWKRRRYFGALANRQKNQVAS
ncbi:hypothetical protein PhaeoP59_00125 [Phaeobacter inhibens]|nr:hypothetical protein PhaeoP59_00125 [Phaeobacter inhibens]